MSVAKVKGKSQHPRGGANGGKWVTEEDWFSSRYRVGSRRVGPPAVLRMANLAGLPVACRRLAFADTDADSLAAIVGVEVAFVRFVRMRDKARDAVAASVCPAREKAGPP